MIDFVVGIEDDFTEGISQGLSEAYGRPVQPYYFTPSWYDDANLSHKINARVEDTRGRTGLFVLRNRQGREPFGVENYCWTITGVSYSLLRKDRFAARELYVVLPMLPDQKADKNWPVDPRPEVIERDSGKVFDYQLLPMLLTPAGVSEILVFHGHPRHLRRGDTRSVETFEYCDEKEELIKTLKLTSSSLINGFSSFVGSGIESRKPLVVSPEKLGGAGVRLAIDFARSLGLGYHQIMKIVDEQGKATCDEPYDAKRKDILIIDDFTKSFDSITELLKQVRNPGNVYMAFIHLDLTPEGVERFDALVKRKGDYKFLPKPEIVFTTNSLVGDIFDHELIRMYDIVPEIVAHFAQEDSP